MRELTGNWYLEKRLFNYRVMVEVIQTYTCEYSLDESPEFISYVPATKLDLMKLEIKVA